MLANYLIGGCTYGVEFCRSTLSDLKPNRLNANLIFFFLFSLFFISPVTATILRRVTVTRVFRFLTRYLSKVYRVCIVSGQHRETTRSQIFCTLSEFFENVSVSSSANLKAIRKQRAIVKVSDAKTTVDTVAEFFNGECSIIVGISEKKPRSSSKISKQGESLDR